MNLIKWNSIQPVFIQNYSGNSGGKESEYNAEDHGLEDPLEKG